MLRLAGVLILCCIAYALVTGQAYWRGTVRRDEHPWNYWAQVATWCILAILLLVKA